MPGVLLGAGVVAEKGLVLVTDVAETLAVSGDCPLAGDCLAVGDDTRGVFEMDGGGAGLVGV